MTPTMSQAKALVGIAGFVSTLLVNDWAAAQTWAGNRSTPAPGELVAVDETGENDWLFGSEDVAGDGLNVFMQQEQSIDIRTAYASATAQQFYFRLYVSDTGPPGGNVSGYVFIDVDRNAATGGSGLATEIDPRFDSDESPGGYEYVFAVQGNGSVLDLWQWDDPADQYETAMLTPNQADAEAGTDRDPITASATEHGYLQGMIDLDQVGLAQNCAANLYFRSLNETAALGDGDLDVGQVGACQPSDRNQDGVPDVLVPRERCTEDEQCPINAVCIAGDCVFTGVCQDDGDCSDQEECNPDGYCVAREGDACTENADCRTRRCSADTCARCSQDSQCDEGYRCAADGRCVTPGEVTGPDEGLELNPGDEVRGGACTCGFAGRASQRLWLLLAFPILLAWRRKR